MGSSHSIYLHHCLLSEKFVLLEKNLKTCQDELQRKNSIILELKEEIKDAKDHGNCIAQIEEISILFTVIIHNVILLDILYHVFINAYL